MTVRSVRIGDILWARLSERAAANGKTASAWIVEAIEIVLDADDDAPPVTPTPKPAPKPIAAAAKRPPDAKRVLETAEAAAAHLGAGGSIAARAMAGAGVVIGNIRGPMQKRQPSAGPAGAARR